MSSGIAMVCMLAMLCAAGGVLLWSRGVHRRDAQLARHFLERQMTAAGSGTRAENAPKKRMRRRSASTLGDLMRRASVRNPQPALSIWALVTGALALVCSMRVGPVMSLGAVAISALVFYAALAWRAQKRKQKIARQLPAFLDGIVRLVGIGNSVQAAFQAAASSAPAPLAECLEDVMPRVRTGVDIDQALTAVARVYCVREFELIGAVLRISIKFGGRADVMLDRMAAFMRDVEQADRELVALSTETRLSSWVLGLLPVVLGGAVILLNPEYFASMWSDALGQKLVYGAFGLQALGAWLLYRLARLRT